MTDGQVEVVKIARLWAKRHGGPGKPPKEPAGRRASKYRQLREAAAAVIKEWDERGDGGCGQKLQDALREARGRVADVADVMTADDFEKDADQMHRRMAQIHRLHVAKERTIEAFNDAGYPQAVTLKTCVECDQDWPCRTVRAAKGERVV